jgi:hypothetical protein
MGVDEGHDGSPELIREPAAAGPAALAGYQAVSAFLGNGRAQPLNLANAEVENPRSVNLVSRRSRTLVITPNRSSSE